MGGVISGLFGGGDDDVEIPKVEAQAVKETAKPVDGIGTEASRKQKRLRASLLTRGFGEPTLGAGGLSAV